MLYGASPFPGVDPAEYGLNPVMTFKAPLISVKRQKKGDAIGYGGAYICAQDMPIGIAAIGYGDGYPRHAPSGTPVLVAVTTPETLPSGAVGMLAVTSLPATTVALVAAVMTNWPDVLTA